MTRKVDPIHFFDSRGTAMVSKDFLLERVRVLEATVEKLKHLLTSQVKKNKVLNEGAVAPPAPRLH